MQLEGHDVRLMKTTKRPYTTRDAYAALDSAGESSDIHGRRVWKTKLPNKVKIFAWLYFKDRISTKVNLFAKHMVENDKCERCTGSVEDRLHVFFGCAQSKFIWTTIGMENLQRMSDEDVWSATPPACLNKALWPFVFFSYTLANLGQQKWSHLSQGNI
jgi:hypothetical protein